MRSRMRRRTRTKKYKALILSNEEDVSIESCTESVESGNSTGPSGRNSSPGTEINENAYPCAKGTGEGSRAVRPSTWLQRQTRQDSNSQDAQGLETKLEQSPPRRGGKEKKGTSPTEGGEGKPHGGETRRGRSNSRSLGSDDEGEGGGGKGAPHPSRRAQRRRGYPK